MYVCIYVYIYIYIYINIYIYIQSVYFNVQSVYFKQGVFFLYVATTTTPTSTINTTNNINAEYNIDKTISSTTNTTNATKFSCLFLHSFSFSFFLFFFFLHFFFFELSSHCKTSNRNCQLFHQLTYYLWSQPTRIFTGSPPPPSTLTAFSLIITREKILLNFASCWKTYRGVNHTLPFDLYGATSRQNHTFRSWFVLISMLGLLRRLLEPYMCSIRKALILIRYHRNLCAYIMTVIYVD